MLSLANMLHYFILNSLRTSSRLISDFFVVKNNERKLV